MITSIAGLALSTLTAWAPPAPTSEAWIADFDQAVEVARKENKDLLVDFTGSDWCGWCTKLHEEVFGHEEFVTAAQKSFVLVALDYPRKDEAKAKVPNPKRNDELRKKYEIQGYPTVLVMNAGGEVFASTGYRPGGVEEYLKHVEEISTAGRKQLADTKAVLAAFESAQGDAKMPLWEKAVTLLEGLEQGSPFASQVAEPVRWAFEADPQNEKGMKLRAVKALIAAGQADDATKAAGKELDPKNEHGILEKLVESQFGGVRDDDSAKAALSALDSISAFGFKDKKVGFQLNFMAAHWANGPLKDPEAAKKYALAAKDIGTSIASGIEDEEERQAHENMMQALETLLAG